MANSTQARKRVRQSSKRYEHNKSKASRMRTAIKQVVNAINAKDKESAVAKYKIMVSVVDNAAQDGLIHRNKAARHKSRLNKHIVAL